MFRPEEVKVALEVFDAALGIGRGRDPDYESAGVELDGRLAGWACWGPTPCTVGTFDLYWIVVSAERQGQGVGSTLLAEVERRVTGRARLIVVETAGRDQYAATRGFYESRGYRVETRIADYYEPGDDLVTYVKRIQESGLRDQGEGISLTTDS
jgi:D-alanine-D-alanine ligase